MNRLSFVLIQCRSARIAEMDMLREMGQQCATAATANAPEYVDCMQDHQARFQATCAVDKCQERMFACAQSKCAELFAAASATDDVPAAAAGAAGGRRE
jgi:hypothetical protein